MTSQFKNAEQTQQAEFHCSTFSTVSDGGCVAFEGFAIKRQCAVPSRRFNHVNTNLQTCQHVLPLDTAEEMPFGPTRSRLTRWLKSRCFELLFVFPRRNDLYITEWGEP